MCTLKANNFLIDLIPDPRFNFTPIISSLHFHIHFNSLFFFYIEMQFYKFIIHLSIFMKYENYENFCIYSLFRLISILSTNNNLYLIIHVYNNLIFKHIYDPSWFILGTIFHAVGNYTPHSI